MKASAYLLLPLLLLSQFATDGFAQQPYELRWSTDGWILAGGLTAGVSAQVVNRGVDPLTPEEVNALSRDDVNGFDRGATNHYNPDIDTGSDILLAGMVLAPSTLLLSGDARTVAVMYAETVLWSFSASSLVKALLPRTRPFVYNPAAPLPEKLSKEARRSFFSGHTTASFSSAVFLSTVFAAYHPHSKWRKVVWAGTLLGATTVGVLRYGAGKHFPSDILVGAGVGSAIGYLVPWLHKTHKHGMSMTPSHERNAFGISILYVF